MASNPVSATAYEHADYMREGYLSEAPLNYLALLGRTYPEGKEEFSGIEELAQEWDLSRLGASPAIFDGPRLLSLNARHIRRLPTEELHRRLEPFLDEPPAAGPRAPGGGSHQGRHAAPLRAPRLVCDLLAPVDP